jgi:hypothetical protein
MKQTISAQSDGFFFWVRPSKIDLAAMPDFYSKQVVAMDGLKNRPCPAMPSLFHSFGFRPTKLQREMRLKSNGASECSSNTKQE